MRARLLAAAGRFGGATGPHVADHRELPENNTLYALLAAARAQFPYIRDSVYGRRAFA